MTKLAQPESMAPAAASGAPVVVRESVVSALVDGNQAPGMLACTRCCDIAAEKCASGPGIACVLSARSERNAVHMSTPLRAPARPMRPTSSLSPHPGNMLT